MNFDQVHRLNELFGLVINIGSKVRRTLSSIELLTYEMGISSGGDWGAALMGIYDKAIKTDEENGVLFLIEWVLIPLIAGVLILSGTVWLLTRRTKKEDERYGEGKTADDYWKEFYAEKDKDTEDQAKPDRKGRAAEKSGEHPSNGE